MPTVQETRLARAKSIKRSSRSVAVRAKMQVNGPQPELSRGELPHRASQQSAEELRRAGDCPPNTWWP